MATAHVEAGICGFTTTVRTHGEGRAMKLEIESDCEHIHKLAAALTEVDPYGEISFRGDGPVTPRAGARALRPRRLPGPLRILKAIEVEAGLALPKDVTITGHQGVRTTSGERAAAVPAAARRRQPRTSSRNCRASTCSASCWRGGRLARSYRGLPASALMSTIASSDLAPCV